MQVVDVSAILNEIPQAKDVLASDMEMGCAWRRYVNEREKPPKVEKPALNTYDLDGMF